MMLDGLAIFFESFKCDKNCPYCIAKDNIQFLNPNENFKDLEKIILEFKKNNFTFDKFILSGNGEPSLQDYDVLKNVVDLVVKYKEMFKNLRFYTSGNLFFEQAKFDLINDNFDQINIMINSLNPEEDMKITKYKKNIWKTPTIKKVKNIKLDISLTKNLDLNALSYDIERKLKDFPNIKKIKLKRLKSHNMPTKQKQWIDENSLSEQVIDNIREQFKLKYECGNTKKDCSFKINDTCNLILNEAGRKTPTKWIFIKNEKIYNYFDEEITLDDIKGW